MTLQASSMGGYGRPEWTAGGVWLANKRTGTPKLTPLDRSDISKLFFFFFVIRFTSYFRLLSNHRFRSSTVVTFFVSTSDIPDVVPNH